MVRLKVDVAAWGELAESLTVRLNEEAPLAEGVPVIAPLVESVSPAGKEPEATVQV